MVARIVVARSVGRLGGRSGLPGLTGALPLVELPPNAPPNCVPMHRLCTAMHRPGRRKPISILVFAIGGAYWCIVVHELVVSGACGAYACKACNAPLPPRHYGKHLAGS